MWMRFLDRVLPRRRDANSQDPVRHAFDARYYRRKNPDVARANIDPFEHFSGYGWREGRNPSADFDTRYYLHIYPDVIKSGLNPLEHFIKVGRQQGRSAKPGPQTSAADWNVEAIRPYFDAAYYLNMNPDVGAAGLDPAAHYYWTGWREGRNPSAEFDTAFYRAFYLDPGDESTNPLMHYALYGKQKGVPTARPKSVLLAKLMRNETKSASLPYQLNTVSPERLLAALKTETLRSGNRTLCVVVSHDDYTRTVGGIQNCIEDEQRADNKIGRAYLQLYPVQPTMDLAPNTPAKEFRYGINLNGEGLGASSIADIIDVFESLYDGDIARPSLVVHSLLGSAPELLVQFATRARCQEIIFWAHDYFAICPSYILMRNDISYCAAPPIESIECTICSYGDRRRANAGRIEQFFERLNPKVFAPSKVAKELWQAHRPVASSISVVPLGRLISESAREMRPDFLQSPLKIAFCGAQEFHKGWEIFSELALKFMGDARYTFLHFGRRSNVFLAADFQAVDGREGERSLMIEALRESKVDVVVIWPLWPETFSYVVHEALAAGAFVITHAGTGNVSRVVEDHEYGIVLRDSEELRRAFETGSIAEWIAAARDRVSNAFRFELRNETTAPLGVEWR